jgi:hypothetical protein
MQLMCAHLWVRLLAYCPDDAAILPEGGTIAVTRQVFFAGL